MDLEKCFTMKKDFTLIPFVLCLCFWQKKGKFYLLENNHQTLPKQMNDEAKIKY